MLLIRSTHNGLRKPIETKLITKNRPPWTKKVSGSAYLQQMLGLCCGKVSQDKVKNPTIGEVIHLVFRIDPTQEFRVF